MANNPAMAPLPDGMRVLSAEEMRRVHDVVHDVARRHRVSGPAADAISFDALAAVGVFICAPEPDPGECAALYLPHTDDVSRGMRGVWQQCADEPGHDGEHDNGEFTWRDDHPGAVPARPGKA